MTDADPAASALDEIRERQALASDASLGFSRLDERHDALIKSCYEDVPGLLAAVEAALEQADDLTRKSEALDAEAEYIAGEHPEVAAVAVLKRERSIAYDECARWFREAITAALAGKDGSDER